MKKYLLYILLLFCITEQLYSQGGGVTSFEIPARNSLKFNRQFINPTFSFVRQQNKYISLTNKQEWMQFDNAPETYLFGYSGRFSENIGAGITLFQQDYGVLTTFGGVANLAYNAVLDRDSNLTFGANLGFYKSGINEGKSIVYSQDPLLEDFPSNSIITINPGINYGTRFLDFGISLNNFVAYSFTSSKMIEDYPEQGFQAHIMYTGYLNNGGFFDESRFTGLISSEFKKDVTVVSAMAMLMVPKGIWVQGGYNSLYAVSAGIGLNITPQIAFEYNYEKGVGGFSNFGNSHDITLAYKFGNSNKYNYSGDDDEDALIMPSKDRSKPRKRKPKKSKSSKKTKKVEGNKVSTDGVELAKVKADKKAQIKLDKEVRLKEAQARKAELARVKAEEEAQVKLAKENRIKEVKAAQTKKAELVRLKAEKVDQAKLAKANRIKEEQARKAELAKVKAEEVAQAKLAEVARLKEAQEEEARKAELARVKDEEVAQAKLAEAARLKATQEEQARKSELAKVKAEEAAQAKLAEAAKLKAAQEAEARKAELARVKAEEATQAKLAEAAKLKEAQEAQARKAELAKVKAEEAAQAKLAEAARLKVAQEEQARKEELAKVKAEEAAQAKLAESARLKEAQEEQARKAELARVQAEEATQAKLAEAARLKEAQEAQARKDEIARVKAEEAAQAKLTEAARLKEAQEVEAIKVEAARLKAEEATQAKSAEAARIKAEKEAQIAEIALDEVLIEFKKSTEASKNEQQALINKLNEKVSSKQQDLDNLKEENDLSEKGIVSGPKAFKSVSAENAIIESLKLQIDNSIALQNAKVTEIETLYKERLKKVKSKDDSVNRAYVNTIQTLKSEQQEAQNVQQNLLTSLNKIKVATDFERSRRIKRADYDNDDDRYNKDRATLERIKKFTNPSAQPLTKDDFDNGEALSNIQIVKGVNNVENGYYLVVAVHSDISKRDEFLEKAVAAGQNNINFFFDVNTSKYYIYYEKFDNIGNAKNSLDSNKGNKPYNSKMSLVKIIN